MDPRGGYTFPLGNLNGPQETTPRSVEVSGDYTFQLPGTDLPGAGLRQVVVNRCHGRHQLVSDARRSKPSVVVLPASTSFSCGQYWCIRADMSNGFG